MLLAPFRPHGMTTYPGIDLGIEQFGCRFPFEVSTGILRERKEAGHEVKTVRIMGEYEEYSSEVALGLTEVMGMLMLDKISDTVEY